MNNDNPLSRRGFLKVSGLGVGAAAIASVAPVGAAVAEAQPVKSHNLVHEGDVVLFQGDSITDAGRSRETAGTPNTQSALGSGYAWFAAAELLVDRPNAGLKIYNRGISGNKVYQLAERWQSDCLDLKPNVLSILIGVNDYWHMKDGKYNGTVETYDHDYRQLLERTRKALPKVKFVICEPFLLRTGVVKEEWPAEFAPYRAAAKRIAADFHAVFIPYQSIFDQAVNYAPAAQWAGDGVHPTPAGASLMAYFWLKAAANR